MALDSILSTPVIPSPPKGASSSTTGGSSGGGSGGDSPSTSTSSSSGSANTTDNSSSAGGAARTSGKGSTATRGAKPNSQAQSASSSSSKARQTNATNQTQATAASAARGVATQSKNPGPSFIEALAQTQADAQDGAAATAAAAPQEVTGSIGRQNGAKGAKDDHSDTTGTALGFLSQSLAAAMAGLQSTNPGQNVAANTTTDDDSADAISLAGGGSTIQSVVANIAQGAAEELKAATTATDGKADTPSAASATDNSAAAANAFQAHMAGHAQSTANADALSNKVTTPVADTGFADEVGDKITWMANQGVQSASLQVTPEHLGPVEVRISMQDGSASVTFNAAHADTRAALEQALPRLREMFSTQGLTLTDASVSQQSPRGQPSRQNAIGAIRGVSGDDSTSSVATVTRVPLGLVDTYV